MGDAIHCYGGHGDGPNALLEIIGFMAVFRSWHNSIEHFLKFEELYGRPFKVEGFNPKEFTAACLLVTDHLGKQRGAAYNVGSHSALAGECAVGALARKLEEVVFPALRQRVDGWHGLSPCTK